MRPEKGSFMARDDVARRASVTIIGEQGWIVQSSESGCSKQWAKHMDLRPFPPEVGDVLETKGPPRLGSFLRHGLAWEV